nr:EOG090X02PU [Sida crystallina]
MAPNLEGQTTVESSGDGKDNEAFEDEDRSVNRPDAKANAPETSSSGSSTSGDDPKKKKKKKKKGKDEEEEKAAEGLPPVPFHHLFRFASISDRFLIAVACTAALATGLSMPAMLILFGGLTNGLVGQGLDPETLNQIRCNYSAFINNSNFNISDYLPDDSYTMDQITTFGIGTASIGGILLILGFIFVTCLNITAENQVYRIRSLFLTAVLRQDIGWYDTKASNDFASRITEDLNKLQDGIGEKIGMFVLCLTGFLASIINAFVHGWQLTLVMMCSMPVLTIAMGILGKVQTTLTQNELKAYGKAGGVAEEVIGAIRTVMAFGGQKKEVDRFASNLVFARKAGIKRGLATGIGAGLVWGVIYASYALAFWYGTTLILDSCNSGYNYDPSSLIIVFFSVLMGAMQIGQAAPYVEAFMVARGAAANIFDIIERKPPIDSASTEGLKPDKFTGNISFEKVGFHYPSRVEVPILQGISFSVSAGQTVALVGSSGCGKSTCIQLLQRFYDPLEGAINVDGHDIRTLNLGCLRDQMGVVGQEPVLFGTTIGENIKFGKENISQAEVEQAAREANAHDFIMRLPLKYDTLVGERGAQLSGGQKQRIAIARALVRNPKILLLDEATSALDTQSESVVQRALDKARLGRTTIIVAHRLTTIRNADRIIVLRYGQVAEEGTHSVLMAKRGIYYQLVESQGGADNNDVKRPEAKLDDSEDEEDKAVDWMPEEEEFALPEALSQSNPTAFGRTGSVRRSSRISASHSKKKLAKVDEVPDVSLMEILKLNRTEWPYITLGVLGSVIVGLSTPAYAILFSEVLGTLSKPDQEEARSQSNFYSLLFLIVGIIVGLSAFTQSFSFSIAGEYLTSRIRKLTFETIIKQEIGWFDREENSVGALCARISGDASSVQGATGSRIGLVLQATSTLIVSVCLALYYQWKLGLVTLVFVPLLLIATYMQAKIIMGQNAMEKDGLEKSAKVAMEAIANIRTVASLRKEVKFHDLYLSSLREPHLKAQRNAWIRGLIFGFASSIPMFAYSVCMYYGGYLVENEGLLFTSVFKVSESLIFGTQMVAQAVAFAPNYNKAKVAANRIFALLRRVPSIDASSQEGQRLDTASGFVDFEKVKFFYPTRKEVQVLKGLTMNIHPGQTVALVGHSGCGKSTCIQLLERFYDPVEGQVKLDHHPIVPMNITSLRSHLGIVSQEPVLFNRTIADNIAYGDNLRTVSMDEIIAAARQANIHTFIQSLPLGYETMVGERGTQLSGGQKQRVAIARALVRNPRVLLLDEATSALDSESEKVVQEALDLARQGRTCITIAHRLSTIQNADNIIVINQGEIAEQGTHAQLLQQKGIYFELCSIQGLSSVAEGDEHEASTAF